MSSLTLVEYIVFASKSCKDSTPTIVDALKIIQSGKSIVKIPNVPFYSVIYRNNDDVRFLSHYVTNFRTLDGLPIGHLDTKIGKIPIPLFWPTNLEIYNKYGIPERKEKIDILVDVYLINKELNNKIISEIQTLPNYQTSGF